MELGGWRAARWGLALSFGAGGQISRPRRFGQGLGPELLARARRYAYHFFFNRMIPLPFVEPKAGYPIYRLKLESLQQLLPGASAGLDTLCEGVLGARPFVMTDRDAPLTDLAAS